MDCPNTPAMFEKYPDVVGVNELCEMLGGINKRLAYSILSNNLIPSIRVGREYKITKIDVIAFFLKQKK